MPRGETFPLRVPIACPSCSGNLTAVLGFLDQDHKPDPWPCPYCFKLQVTDLGGPIVYVGKRTDGPVALIH